MTTDLICLCTDRGMGPVSEIKILGKSHHWKCLWFEAVSCLYAHTDMCQRKPKLNKNGQKASNICVLAESFQEMGIRKKAIHKYQFPGEWMGKGVCKGF